MMRAGFLDLTPYNGSPRFNLQHPTSSTPGDISCAQVPEKRCAKHLSLIVSDDRLFARLVVRKLESWGHRTSVASTGTKAYEQFEIWPFRIVVISANLPDMSGPELCTRIRALKRLPYTYVLICNGARRDPRNRESEGDSIVAGLEAGADDHLTLPYDPNELRLRIRNADRMLNLEDELRERAGTDSLTGLINGASLRQYFRMILAQTRSAGGEGALMFVKVDNYREVSGKFGYDCAQQLIVGVSEALTRSIHDSILVAKVSDDEFCLLLHNTSWKNCIPIAETIDASIGNIVIIADDLEFQPRVSIGGVGFPADELSSDDIFTLGRIPYQAYGGRASACR